MALNKFIIFMMLILVYASTPYALISLSIAFFALAIFLGSVGWSFFGFVSLLLSISFWMFFFKTCKNYASQRDWNI